MYHEITFILWLEIIKILSGIMNTVFIAKLDN